MKSILLLLICTITAANTHAQSFTATTTNTNANSKMIVSGNNPIYKNSMRSTTQVQSNLNVKNNSVTGYDLNFYTAPLTTSDNTSTPNTCLLQDGDGNSFTGTLKNKTKVDPSGITKYSCTFSVDDFYKIAAVKKITAIKIFSADNKTGNLPLSNGLQETILAQAKSLLAALQTQQ